MTTCTLQCAGCDPDRGWMLHRMQRTSLPVSRQWMISTGMQCLLSPRTGWRAGRAGGCIMTLEAAPQELCRKRAGQISTCRHPVASLQDEGLSLWQGLHRSRHSCASVCCAHECQLASTARHKQLLGQARLLYGSKRAVHSTWRREPHSRRSLQACADTTLQFWRTPLHLLAISQQLNKSR